jgi:assimilatory nitrate reductase catalytic subunit
VAAACGLETKDVALFYDWFAGTPRVVSCYSQGVNQSAQGTDKVNAIINCHLATGRIGRPGTGPLSLTGQPNAMGGREVGGLANMLAAHMGFTRERAAPPGRRPMVSGEGLGRPMFDAIADGRINTLWVMGLTCRALRAGAGDALASGSVVSENVESNDTAAAHQPPPPGARRRAPSPTRSVASRANAPSWRHPVWQDRIGGS